MIFWDEYPRKENKVQAIKAWNKIKPNGQLLDKFKSWLYIAKQSAQWSNKDKIPRPSTWLNQRRWEADPPPSAESNIKTQKRDYVDQGKPVSDEMTPERQELIEKMQRLEREAVERLKKKLGK